MACIILELLSKTGFSKPYTSINRNSIKSGVIFFGNLYHSARSIIENNVIKLSPKYPISMPAIIKALGSINPRNLVDAKI
ncbi:hypothetical protein MHTCC0001_33900 [Flavobacteriaceae bacterium MHTCC 0001]